MDDKSRNRTSGFCADFTELVYTSILSSIPASHQKADQLTLFVQLLINSETALALVVFDMREKLVDVDSAESWAQRQVRSGTPDGSNFRPKIVRRFFLAGAK